MHHSNTPLRAVLRSALTMREAALRNMRSHRKDQALLRAAMGRAEMFLRSYPVADDARVRSWCRDHRYDVVMVVPGNKPGMLAELLQP